VAMLMPDLWVRREGGRAGGRAGGKEGGDGALQHGDIEGFEAWTRGGGK
jgi:hypothetical protein